MRVNRKTVEDMDYSNIVALVRERNRPSGGIRTVQNVAVNAFVNASKKMLEIGCNTGFTSVNMSLLTRCSVIGIDINEESIREAKRYAKEQGVEDKVEFKVANALCLPFQDNYFDLVWCSNVTSFIENKEKAIKEYLRVLKWKGTLVAVPIYYVKRPPKTLLKKISKAIGTRINYWTKDFWLKKFESVSEKFGCRLELYYNKDFLYLDRKKEISKYVEYMVAKPHLQKLNKEEKNKLKRRLKDLYILFNENLKYAGFSILFYQKRRINDEIELFITKEK